MTYKRGIFSRERRQEERGGVHVTSMATRRRPRLQRSLLALAICAISYTILWTDDDSGSIGNLRRRRLAYLDGTDATANMGAYKSSPHYTSLVKPSTVDTSVHRGVHMMPMTLPIQLDGILLYMPSTLAHDGAWCTIIKLIPPSCHDCNLHQQGNGHTRDTARLE